MNISQVTANDDEALEYLNVLVTVELAAEIHRNKPNTAIRKTVARLLPRMNHPRVKAIMVGLARQAYPSGCLLMRFIPADAGNSLSQLLANRPITVHPRGRGEQLNP